MKLVLTCEHFSATIPKRYRAAFSTAADALKSHRGWDIGAPGIFRELRPLAVADFKGSFSRLLIDLNRSERHPQCFSLWSRSLPESDRQALIAEVHQPFRVAVAGEIGKRIAAGNRVLHLSVHSFTPVLDGVERNADIGLLYDPSRSSEKSLALVWGEALTTEGWRVRRNYPYRGTADGHTTALRRAFFEEEYLGIELEVNQRITGKRALLESVRSTLAALL